WMVRSVYRLACRCEGLHNSCVRLPQDIEVARSALKSCEQFVAAVGDPYHLAMTEAAVAIDVNRRFDVEDHARNQRFTGLRMNLRPGIRRNRRETDTVPRGMFKFFFESMVTQYGSRSPIHGCRFNPRLNRVKRRLQRFENSVVYLLLPGRRFP